MNKFRLGLLVCYWAGNCACHSLEQANEKLRLDNKSPSDSSTVNVKFVSDTFELIATIRRTDLIKKFDEFYEDKSGHFFIRSYGHQRSKKHEFEPVEVFIEIPKLDSATYKNWDSYIMDSSKVICVFANSDGGNYVLLKDADPKSFHAFKNAFGGKDKNHVFYQAKMLEGLNPSTVKVYSDLKNCTNCRPWFKDEKTCYFGEEKSGCSVPSEYKFVE